MKRQPRAYRAGNRVEYWIGVTAGVLVFVGIPAAIIYGIVALAMAV